MLGFLATIAAELSGASEAELVSGEVRVHGSNRSELDLSKGWVQGIALVMIFGFFVMGILSP